MTKAWVAATVAVVCGLGIAGLIVLGVLLPARVVAATFPPMTPLIMLAVVLFMVAFRVVPKGLARRLLLIAAVITVLAVVGAGTRIAYHVDKEPDLVCMLTVANIPQDSGIRLPEETVTEPQIDFDWLGQYTCRWEPETWAPEGIVYSEHPLVLLNLMVRFWLF